MNEILKNYRSLQARVAEATQAAGRKPESVKIVAVSKLQPAEKVNQLLESSEQCLLGENYVQEFEAKRALLRGSYCAHLIGPLQSNKIKKAVACFDVIQSVHSEKVLFGLEKEANSVGKTLKILLQVNISKDPGKQGFEPEALTPAFFKSLGNLKAIKMEGLMTIPALVNSRQQTRAWYRDLRQLGARAEDYLSRPLEISMGMSDDFEIAVAEGATLVRIGTALFGARNP